MVSTTPPHREAIHHAVGGVQVAAGHRFLSCVAYAEKNKDPRVLVLVHPGFRVVRKLPGEFNEIFDSAKKKNEKRQ